jgi:hypothetical protein
MNKQIDDIDNIDEAIPNTQKNSLSVKLPKYNTFFTIDPYVSLLEYNQALQSLENNKINYTELISLMGKYYWYLSLENNQTPIMMNYDKMDRTNWTKTVTKVKPLKSNDIYLLYRRGEKSDVAKYIENDVFKKARRNKSVVFKIKNKEDFIRLSKLYGEIYPLGVYFNGSIKLGICFNTEIKNSITPDRIVLEMGPHKLGELELAINYNVLRNQDKIIKYTETPYFKNGKFYPTSPMSPLKIV